ncbi:MAG: helix-turn-helix domain-containing protein [Verrucomicrobia bacterium]|nr:helix-turn-helix domain-containing protein [Verrucomicrobiota bacterium]
MATAVQHRRLLGRNIRAVRTRRGLSQEKLAEKADLHPVFVGRIERGEETISFDRLARIAKALRVPVRDLVKGL